MDKGRFYELFPILYDLTEEQMFQILLDHVANHLGEKERLSKEISDLEQRCEDIHDEDYRDMKCRCEDLVDPCVSISEVERKMKELATTLSDAYEDIVKFRKSF